MRTWRKVFAVVVSVLIFSAAVWAVDCTGGPGPDATDVVQLLNNVFLGTPFSGC